MTKAKKKVASTVEKTTVIVEPTVFAKPAKEKWKGGHHVNKSSTKAIVAYGREHTDATSHLIRSICTGEDLFHAALLWNAFDRHIVYPLPLIRQPDLAMPTTANVQPGEGQVSVANNTDYWFGNAPAEVLRPCFSTNNTFRYGVFHGLVQGTAYFTVAGGSSRELWIFFDPLCESNPVSIMEYTDPANPRAVLNSEFAYSGWTNTPNVLPQSLQAHGARATHQESVEVVRIDKDGNYVAAPDRRVNLGGPPPIKNNLLKDKHNLYWEGGAQLNVGWLNPNFHGSVAMRVRTNTNVNHRVLNNLQFFPEGTATTNSPLFTVPFEHAQSARAGYSGDQWDALKSYSDLATDQASKDFATYAQADHCLRRGKPFIQVLLNSSSGTASSFSLSLTGECWNGITSFRQQIVGSLPYETVPFDIPTWWIAAKSSGELTNKSQHGSGIGMGFDSVGNIVQMMGSHTPLNRAVAQAQSVPAIHSALKSIAPVVQSNSLNHDLVGEALKTVGGITVAKQAPALLRKARALPTLARRIPSAAKTVVSKPASFFQRLGNAASKFAKGGESEGAMVEEEMAGISSFLQPVSEVAEFAAI